MENTLSLFELTSTPRESRKGDKRLTPNEAEYHLPRVSISLVRDGHIDTGHFKPTQTITSPETVAGFMQATCNTLDREAFFVLLMDTRNQIIAVHPCSVGSVNASIVHPRETFKAAIVAGAAAIICVHNHPSGDPTPSKEDIAITSRLVEAGVLLGIPVFDHVVMGFHDDNAGTRFVSFKQQGLM